VTALSVVVGAAVVVAAAFVRSSGGRAIGAGAGVAALVAALLIADRQLAGTEQYVVEVEDSEARFRSLVQHASDVVMVIDSHLRFSYLSPSVARLLGYQPDQLAGVSLTRLLHIDDVAHAAWLNGHDPLSGPQAVELRLRHANGEWLTMEVTVTDLRTDAAVEGIVLTGRDVTDRKALEVELRHRALHDALTGLANRDLFIERIVQALGPHADVDTVAVVFIDLDDFKVVNDGMGHLIGDRLLVETARRLRGCVRSTDTAARLGGDEFAVLVTDISGPNDGPKEMEILAQRILSGLGEPVIIEGQDVRVRATIGVATNQAGVNTAEQLLGNADRAMYAAKERGKSCWQLFDPAMAGDQASIHVIRSAS
jgi:diguanylate cyclase (GGDEF)-like protein/PAS domain S-box-containing protein